MFQRDKFTCQYCGKTTPEVILEVDHVTPKSKGGTDDFDNLITSCRECNRGKSDFEVIPNIRDTNPDTMRRLADEDLALMIELDSIKKRLKVIFERRKEISILEYDDLIAHEKFRINSLTDETIKENPDWEGETVQHLRDSFNQNIGICELQKMQTMDNNKIEVVIELDK